MSFDGGQVLARPGERRIHSNRGFEVLAELLEDRAEMPFERYVTEGVLEPLGMGGTRLEGSAASGMVGPVDDLLRLASELLGPRLVSTETLALATAAAFPGLDGVLPGVGRFRDFGPWALQAWPRFTDEVLDELSVGQEVTHPGQDLPTR